jgi:hypothetical protein
VGRLVVLIVSLLAISAAAWRAPSRNAPAPPSPGPREEAPEPEAAAPPIARPLWQALPAAAPEATASGVSGILVGADGERLGGLIVIEPLERSWHDVRRTASGEFRFDVPPGRYLLRAIVPRFEGEAIELTIDRGERLEGIELRMTAPPAPSVEQDDVQDRCPDQPDNDADNDGCPEPEPTRAPALREPRIADQAEARRPDPSYRIETDENGLQVIRLNQLIY